MISLQSSLAAGDLTFDEIHLAGGEGGNNSWVENAIGSQGLNSLAEGLIQAQIHLQKLGLFGNDIEMQSEIETNLDETIVPSFTRLITGGWFDELEVMDVAGNSINEVTLSQICSAVIDTAVPLVLQEFWIGGCDIGDDGVVVLASLIRNGFLPCLRQLSVNSYTR